MMTSKTIVLFGAGATKAWLEEAFDERSASEARMRSMFGAVDRVLRENPEVGAYNQTI